MKTVNWNTYSELYDLLLDLPNYVRLQQRVVEMAQLKNGMSVLDIGCGTGNTTMFITNLSKKIDVTSLDSSLEMLARAKTKLSHEKVKFVEGAQENLPFPDHSYDVIVSTNVLYTCKDVDETLTEWHRVLKHDGRLVVANPYQPELSYIFGEFLLNVTREGDEKILQDFMTKFVQWRELIAINDTIVTMAKGRKYHFLPVQQLAAALERNGFAVEQSELAYGPTVVIMSAVKRLTDG